MAKQCPRPGCKEFLRKAPGGMAKASKKDAVGTAKNPIILRCTKCRKNFEFKGGRVTEIARH